MCEILTDKVSKKEFLDFYIYLRLILVLFKYTCKLITFQFNRYIVGQNVQRLPEMVLHLVQFTARIKVIVLLQVSGKTLPIQAGILFVGHLQLCPILVGNQRL